MKNKFRKGRNKLVHLITIGHNIDLALIVYGSSFTGTTLRNCSIDEWNRRKKGSESVRHPIHIAEWLSLKKRLTFFRLSFSKKTDPANIKSKDLLPLKFSRVSTYWKKNFKLFFLVQTKTSGKQFLEALRVKKELRTECPVIFFTLSLLSNKLYRVYLRL